MTLLEALYDAYVRPLNLQLSWRLNESSRNRLLLAGALPAIVIAGLITAAALSYIFSPSELYYGEFLEGGPGEFWRLLYRATTTLSVLQPAAVGASSSQECADGRVMKEAGCFWSVLRWPVSRYCWDAWQRLS